MASVYGKILKDLGYLSKGQVIEKMAGELVGSVVGQTEETMRNLIRQSKGCVLVVDEAYSLTKDASYGPVVLDMLVQLVQGRPGEDIAVLLLG